MIKRTKVWTSLGAAALAGTATLALLSACGEGGEGKAKSQAQTPKTGASTAGSGEGEGAPVAVDLKTDNVAYLVQLSLVEGHLTVGHELYAQGALDAAAPHMKHPAQELYPALAPILAARGATPFDGELHDLADAVGHHAAPADVDAAFEKAMAALAAAETAKTGNTLQDPKSVVLLIEKIVRVAGGEYAAAIQDGRVVEPVEFQDAYGFTKIAKARLTAISANQPQKIADVLAQVRAQLDSLDVAWPQGHLIPDETVTATQSLFYGAAARIEIAALSL